MESDAKVIPFIRSPITFRVKRPRRRRAGSHRGRFFRQPESMQYFYDLFHRVYCQGEELKHEGLLVGTTCIHAPEELIYAFGATPVRLCKRSYHYDQRGGFHARKILFRW